MERNSFQLGYELTDYGKLRFDFDGKIDELEMSSQRRKAMFSNPLFYYLLTLVFILVVWFIASLVINSIKYGFAQSFGMHISGLFAVFVMSTIVLLSAFGGWAKFANIAKNANAGTLRAYREAETKLRDNSISRNNSIQIYEEWLVITNYGWTQVYDLSMVAEVRLENTGRTNKAFTATFISTEGESVHASVIIPRDKVILIQLKKIFKKKLKIIMLKRAVQCPNKPIGTLIGATCFVSIAIFAGTGLILMHYYLEPSIPIFLGLLFIIGGIIGLCGVYSFVPILKDVIMPLLAGVIFIFFPMAIADTILKESGGALTIKEFFGIFNPLSAAVLFFGWLGLLFVIISIKTLIEYIVYREKK